MSRFKHARGALLVLIAGLYTAGTGFAQAQAQTSARLTALANIGRTATPAEVKAWDIDVRPDSRACPRGRAR